jgi:hypothetical protein
MQIQKVIDLEPVLLVFFCHLSSHTVTKDAMSKVSKTFFKELKMNYRNNKYSQTLISVHRFFEWHNETVRSFMQFQIMITCEKLAEEHGNFVYTILKDKTFTDTETLQKFQRELNVFNEFITVLFMCEFKFCRYQAIRALRDA